MVKTLADIKRAVQRKLKKKTINNLKKLHQKEEFKFMGRE